MPESEPTRYKRFSIIYRIEHWLLTASFGLLAVTGMIQIYIDLDLTRWLVGALGGIETVRYLHRIAALMLMLETIYHLGHLGYRLFVLRVPMSMLPGVQDLRNGIQSVRYNLGLSKERARQGYYTFEEKLEYWAVIWGTIIMGLSGFILWNPIATTRLLPGITVPAAKMAHGLEATLAVLAIIVWHIYHVHLRHFNKSIFTGWLSEEEMEDEHPRALAQIESGHKPPEVPPEVLARRRKIFFPIYGVLAIAMLAGVVFFVAYEETAIATVPPAEDVTIFSPLTPTPLPTIPPPPPTATPRPAGAPADLPETWQAGIGALLDSKCSSCHGSSLALGGLDLSSYEAAMAGGDSGPAVVPAEAHTSLLVSRQASGDHPGQLSPAEMEQIVHWIELGALEKAAQP
jgi:cytochrome b subunit of formate dehydrogenase/mono/diheme cytochrome c family protein